MGALHNCPVSSTASACGEVSACGTGVTTMSVVVHELALTLLVQYACASSPLTVPPIDPEVAPGPAWGLSKRGGGSGREGRGARVKGGGNL